VIGVSAGNEGLERTKCWDNVPGVHGVLVLNEPEAIHQFDFGDFASTMSGEMRLDVSFGRWRTVSIEQYCRSEPRLGKTGAVARRFVKGLPFLGKLPR
jgi:hypothetical protein